MAGWGRIGWSNDVSLHWRPRLPTEAFRCERVDPGGGRRRKDKGKTHDVALLEEELGEVGTILTGDTGDKGDLGLGHG